MKTKKQNNHLKNFFFLVTGFFILIASIVLIFIANLEIPDFNSFGERKVITSTRIYDRTGEVILYDIHQDIKRTIVPYSEINQNIKNATIAIEDSDFFNHKGVKISSFIRAMLVNILNRDFSQGGSTITQQVVKNTLLTNDKTPVRKIKEWILAIKMEQVFTKEEILSIYLNEAPYGGNIYGVEEASRAFFNKKAIDLTITESAYLAAVTQAPTFYSPYGKNLDRLEERKNLVLSRMNSLGMITDEDYLIYKNEKVSFEKERNSGIKAPHFVLYIKDYLEKKYGSDMVSQGGLRVITTLDYEFQKKAEEIVLSNAKTFAETNNATNAGLVAIDPKNGHILTMVGSRDYFDTEIDGKFNVTLAKRQPGSSFKPFVYATAFKNGYTPETILFDVPTEFNLSCGPDGIAKNGYNQDNCYMPSNFDDGFRGPMTLRNALAQSINVPAVKLLYLVGLNNAIKTAVEMGITTLNDASRFGLSLVLGGGEVRLLDMVSAYGTFANNGVLNPYTGIIRVEDANGNILEEYTEKSRSVLPENSALTISSILDDDQARIPTFGVNSVMNFGDRDVASKTGTTNDYRDAWIVGYTPSIVVGVWAGNNDNTPMERGSMATRPWRDFMDFVLIKIPNESFSQPLPHPDYNFLKPVFRGDWLPSNKNIVDDFFDGDIYDGNPHSILYYISKDDIHGDFPIVKDNQFNHWEYGVSDWWSKNRYRYRVGDNGLELIRGL